LAWSLAFAIVGRIRIGDISGHHLLALAEPVHTHAYDREDVELAVHASSKDTPNLSAC